MTEGDLLRLLQEFRHNHERFMAEATRIYLDEIIADLAMQGITPRVAGPVAPDPNARANAVFRQLVNGLAGMYDRKVCIGNHVFPMDIIVKAVGFASLEIAEREAKEKS